jgi:hypothetical protein
MTLRIEQRSQQGREVLRLIGQIHSEDLEDFKAQTLKAGSGMVFDLDELTLVDVGVVRYLGECEQRGETGSENFWKEGDPRANCYLEPKNRD